MSTPDPNAPAERLPRSLRSLHRLRERVEEAVREIERLRAENADLRGRVEELARLNAEQTGEAAEPLLPVGDHPEALRQQLEGFIAAVDRVMAERSGPAAPERAQPENGSTESGGAG
ncbi:MAG: hypothetical protein R3362_11165 [Rhodothermales bacterium]|nr:hypothetical protein [Rhodothermales bacterium]